MFRNSHGSVTARNFTGDLGVYAGVSYFTDYTLRGTLTPSTPEVVFQIDNEDFRTFMIGDTITLKAEVRVDNTSSSPNLELAFSVECAISAPAQQRVYATVTNLRVFSSTDEDTFSVPAEEITDYVPWSMDDISIVVCEEYTSPTEKEYLVKVWGPWEARWYTYVGDLNLVDWDTGEIVETLGKMKILPQGGGDS